MKSREWLESLGAAAVKLLLMPSIAFLAASAADLSPEWTGSIVLGFSCPSAVSFFVISRSLGQDPAKSAAIVTATTLGAAFTAGLVVFVLKTAGLV
jgi:predicted permease